jgi:hypothetical protein
MKKTITASLMAAAIGLTGTMFAHASTVATINITEIGGPSDIAAGNTAVLNFLGGAPTIFESFENIATGTRNPDTLVGSFAGFGTAGSGDTAVDCGSGLGDGACVKPLGTAGGRYATDGANWLDSNDMNGIEWTIPGANGKPTNAVTAIAFLLTDIDDVGSLQFAIEVSSGELLASEVNSDGVGTRPEPDATLHLVEIGFTAPVELVQITMTNGNGDGFGIDSVGMNVVPLPAAGWMLLAGIGGLVAMKRRRKAA